MSLLDNEIVFAKSTKGGIEARIEELSGSREKTETARAALLGDRFTGGILLSEDSRHGAVLITTLADGTNDMEDSISWVEGIHAVFLRQGYREENLHRAGGIAIVSEMMKQTHFNLERLFPVVCLLLILTVYVLFRKLWPALVSTSIAVGMQRDATNKSRVRPGLTPPPLIDQSDQRPPGPAHLRHLGLESTPRCALRPLRPTTQQRNDAEHAQFTLSLRTA